MQMNEETRELIESIEKDVETAKERIKRAREVGNKQFALNKYDLAVSLYDYGLQLLVKTDDDVALLDETKKANLTLTLLSNKAACLIKVRFVILNVFFVQLQLIADGKMAASS